MPLLPLRTLLAMAAAAIALTTASCGTKPPLQLHGIIAEQAAQAPTLRLTDAKGATFDLAAQKGKTVLLYFGYTNCPDACPTALSDWAAARRALGAAVTDVRFVFVTVDPPRDSPAVAAAYVLKFDSTFTGLAANDTQLEAIKAAWGFATAREDMPTMPGMKHDGYGVMHPAQTFVITNDGMLRMIYSPGTRPADIAADLKQLR